MFTKVECAKEETTNCCTVNVVDELGVAKVLDFLIFYPDDLDFIHQSLDFLQPISSGLLAGVKSLCI